MYNSEFDDTHSEVLSANLVESMSCLEDYIRMFTKSKRQPNFISPVIHNVPKGVGNNPGKLKHKGPSISKFSDVVSDIVTYVDLCSPLMESSPA